MKATARAHPNIAFIKYWGNRNHELRLPANSSLSMNLAGLHTITTVEFVEGMEQDRLWLNGAETAGPALERMASFLDVVRGLSGLPFKGQVQSENNFPSGAGIASSASAFAALALAASRAAGLDLDEPALSRLARRGSGSASRSVPGGFVEWLAADEDEHSLAFSIAPPDYWDLVDCIAVISRAHKSTTSSQGHHLADSSPLQAERVAGAGQRLEACRAALLRREFVPFADVVEADSDLMHGVMQSSTPPLQYMLPETKALLAAVRKLRAEGLPACYTVDAGPNVHVICLASAADEVAERLATQPGVQQVLRARPGGPAHSFNPD